MRTFSIRVLLALCALALPLALFAAEGDLQPIPPFGPRVTDLTGTLTPQQIQSMTSELEALERSKGSRVAVLIVPTTAPEDIAQYSIRVTDAWKLSRSDGHTQDGVLLTVAKNDHRVRIDVGRDLEGAIPDAANARIIREYISPKFRQNDFYGGIEDALGAITKLINDEPLPPPLTDDRTARKHNNDIFNALVWAFFIGLWARAMFGRLPTPPRAGVVGLASGGAAWLLSGLVPLGIGVGIVGLVFGLLGGGGGGFANRGGWGGWGGGLGGGSWGGGGSGGGGFGGGGFSGGSGGGFSGGGASGGW